MTADPVFPIATRRSPLAQTQSGLVASQLAAAMPNGPAHAEDRFPLKTFITSGDKNLSGSLAEIGGKGLFTKEIEDALLRGDVRFAVHSIKDMPADLPHGLIIAAIPPREDPRDCFISHSAPRLDALPAGAMLGASSVRRIAQARAKRPDLRSKPLRGNVESRLEKIAQGDADATFLALSGLKRLGKQDLATQILSTDDMLPAVGQGALCIQAREDDQEAIEIAAAINCQQTTLCVHFERGFLAFLDGSCRTPIAGLAQIKSETLIFRGEILSLDGSMRFTIEHDVTVDGLTPEKASTLGRTTGERLRQQIGETVFADLTRG